MAMHSKRLVFAVTATALAAVAGGGLYAGKPQRNMPLFVASAEVGRHCVWTRRHHGTFRCSEFTAAYVQIVDQQGQGVSGARVTGVFTGCDENYTASANTDNKGQGWAIVKGPPLECDCVHTFTVTGVTKTGWSWNPTDPLPSASACICGDCN